MKITALKKVLEILCGASKYSYELIGSSKGHTYQFSIEDSKLRVTLRNDSKGFSMLTDLEVDDIMTDEIILKKLIEKRQYKGVEVEKIETKLLREAELYLKLFKAMDNQAAFVIQNDSTYKLCYFINGKTFYIESSDQIYELHEDTLFKIYSLVNKGEITMVSRLPKQYSYKDFFIEQNQIAVKLGRKFLNLKKGVVVNG